MFQHLRIYDIVYGRPARDLNVRLELEGASSWKTVYSGRTDRLGDVRDIQPDSTLRRPGTYRVTIELATYFGLLGLPVICRDTALTFRCTDTHEVHSLTVMISPVAVLVCGVT